MTHVGYERWVALHMPGYGGRIHYGKCCGKRWLRINFIARKCGHQKISNALMSNDVAQKGAPNGASDVCVP